MSIKTCPKCGRDLPATIEFFSPNKTGRFGLYSICRKCKSEDKQYKEKYKLRHNKNKDKDLRRKKQLAKALNTSHEGLWSMLKKMCDKELIYVDITHRPYKYAVKELSVSYD